MSSDEEMPNQEESQNEDLQLAFVTMLEDYKIILDKKMTPPVKSAKDKALKEFTETRLTAGTSQDVDISLTDEENQIPFCDDKELMAKLRKKLLLQQINTAAAQKKAAIAQEKAALAVERAAGAVEQFVEDYFARQQASF
ncbi:unnamed protein product [Acanthoscelides obtectus]|uniref:Uncharacterized protein n=1 Tax=Acanthoscelides obtectus TaxID=200917 RepID=A0A9P0LG33_ACAOB|nr:unnamed protein product [Acanthoscelides obtectus]CAK1621785.1 hypothetical protein AOBTE_LOCUS1125 [Acanthoscelides obtectus]